MMSGPGSAIDLQGMDIDDERLTPNRLAEICDDQLPGLLTERDAATTKRERKRLSARIRLLRSMSSWAKSRAGYVEPPKKKRARPEQPITAGKQP